MATDVYVVNAKHVVQEIIDGEAVVVNLDKGSYYSLQGGGALAWEWLLKGADAATLVAGMEARFEAEPGVIEANVSELLDRLVEEGLVVQPATAAAAKVPDWEGPRTPFVAMAVEVFTDIQDLLLLDPIHDTDEQGWPTLPG